MPDLYSLRADEAATRLEGGRWVSARRRAPRPPGPAWAGCALAAWAVLAAAAALLTLILGALR